jgi:hypothetical protein
MYVEAQAMSQMMGMIPSVSRSVIPVGIPPCDGEIERLLIAGDPGRGGVLVEAGLEGALGRGEEDDQEQDPGRGPDHPVDVLEPRYARRPRMLSAAISTMNTVPNQNHVVGSLGPRADVGDRLVAADQTVRGEQRSEHELGDPVATDPDPEGLAHRGGEARHEADGGVETCARGRRTRCRSWHDGGEHAVEQVERERQRGGDRDRQQDCSAGRPPGTSST